MKLRFLTSLAFLLGCASLPVRAQTVANSHPADILIPVWQSRDNNFLFEPSKPKVAFDAAASFASAAPAEVHVRKLRSEEELHISQKCAAGELDGKSCKFHWRPALLEQAEDLTVEEVWNLTTNKWIWYATTHGHWFQDWMQADAGFRFSRWNDSNPILDDYVGHPIMGAIAMDIFVQNDPRGKTLQFENSKAYWHSRLWALLWSTIYSAQWKLGPVSEASFGNTGQHVYFDHDAKKWTNGTGSVGLVVTPIGGWVWAIGEDLADKAIIRRLDQKTSNPFYLFSMSFLNPCRGFANLMRYHAPWYRDYRQVPAGSSFGTQTDAEASRQ
ncbi:MAG: hypothetical protein WAK91_10655 [Candidatus Acidiferrales bacterium]|jgi:hypothetical protein